ncbi:MAG: hypothetical protein M1837_001805 [Sclerophora amabilis]|nr:MAG: hypothetical protein M1837_001805 [Sclerophora amabilis]
MKIPLSYMQKGKTAAHVIQALLIFIAWAITIAVFVSKDPTDGRTKYYFAMCWFSIPALVYLIMVPMWPRARRFSNVYAFAAVDALFTILWFAAFVSVATWNSAGIKAGAKKKKVKDGEGSCKTFGFGSERRCNLSKVTVGIGGLIFGLFVITTAISVYGVIHYRKHGYLPGASDQNDPNSIEAQTKDAFSTGDHHDNESSNLGPGTYQEDDEYALLHSTENEEGTHPGRKVTWGRDDPQYQDDYRESFIGEYDDRHPAAHGQEVEQGMGNGYDTSYGRHPSENHPGYPI